MALGLTERLKIIFDVETQTFKQGVKTMKADLASADGFVNKSKVLQKGLFDQLNTYGPQAALAAGAALVAFGVKSVSEFNNAALAAGKFSDATGLSNEEASRLIEVASDLGVEAGTLEGAIRRVNGAARSGALAQLGVEIATTKDGATDVNETFLRTVEAIGAITDASEREAAARKVMGRSWAELAEMTTMSAEDLRDALAAVSDEQIFDNEDVANAREYRAAMDDLKDAVDRVTLATGRGLTPVVTDLAGAVGNVADALGGGGAGGFAGTLLDVALPADNMAESFKELTSGSLTFGEVLRGVTAWMPGFGEGIERLTDKNEKLDTLADATAQSIIDQTNATVDLGDETDETATSVDNVAASFDAAKTSADNLRDAQNELRNSAVNAADGARATEAAMDAYDDTLAELAGTMMDGESTAEDLETANRNAADAAITAAKAYAEQDGASLDSAEGQQRFKEKLEELSGTALPEVQRQIDAYIARLNAIPSTINTQLNVTVNGPVGIAGQSGSPGASGLGRPADAGGGSTMGANSLWQSALNAWGAVKQAVRPSAGDGPTAAEAKANEFDRRFNRLKLKYERGELTPDEYLVALQALGDEYRWGKYSPRGMALWREKQRAKRDRREAIQDAKDAAEDKGRPGSGGGGAGPAGTAGVPAKPKPGPSGGSGGVAININLHGMFIGGENEMRRAVRPLIPAISRELDRLERGQA